MIMTNRIPLYQSVGNIRVPFGTFSISYVFDIWYNDEK